VRQEPPNRQESHRGIGEAEHPMPRVPRTAAVIMLSPRHAAPTARAGIGNCGQPPATDPADPCHLLPEVRDPACSAVAQWLWSGAAPTLVGWDDLAAVRATWHAREDPSATGLLDPAHGGAGRD
jgi:hypothetical protein